MDAKAREKEALFAEIHKLDEPDSDEGDVTPLSAFTKPKAESLSTSTTLATQKLVPSHHSLGRTVSAPLQLVASEEVNVIEDTPPIFAMAGTRRAKGDTATTKRTPISKSFTNAGDTKNTKPPRPGTKRKRGESFEVLPESLKIFTGLSFCTVIDLSPAL